MIIEGKLNKVLYALGISLFLFVSVFGALHMGMGSDSSMNNCPFSVGSSICTMTPLEHIGAAQNLLNTLPSSKNTVYFLWLAFSALLAGVTWYFLKIFTSPKLAPVSAASRLHDQRLSFAPNFLQKAFSAGLLNSKTF